MRVLAILLLLTQTAFAQVTPIPSDRIADFVGVNFHTDIFSGCPGQTTQNLGSVYCDPDWTNILFKWLIDSHIRYVRVGGNASSGDGGTHITEDYARKKMMTDAGLKLTVVLPQCSLIAIADGTCVPATIQSKIDFDCSQYVCTQAEGLNEPVGGCNTIVQAQQTYWNIIRNDPNPAINTLPVLGPSLLPGTCALGFSNTITFNGDVNFGNIHPYIHEFNPDHAGWLHGYFSIYQKAFPNPAGGFLPLVATEFGWTTGWIMPNSTIARYEPRGIAEMILIGYDHGFRHQIADDEPVRWGFENSGYGWIDWLGTIKPQGVAITNLVHMFEDPTPFTPTPIPLAVTHVSGLNPAQCPMPCANELPYGNRQMLLTQRSTGEYKLLIWQGTKDYAAPSAIGIAQLVAGKTYAITKPGNSNWLAVGSPSNASGTAFTATGPGTGTGAAFPVIFPSAVVVGKTYMVAFPGTTTNWVAMGAPAGSNTTGNNVASIFKAKAIGSGDGLVLPDTRITHPPEIVSISTGTTATSATVSTFTDTGAVTTRTISGSAGTFNNFKVTSNLQVITFH